MKKLKTVYVTYMDGNNSSIIVLPEFERINISARFLEIRYAGSKSFVLNLDKLVYYTVQ